MTKTLIYGIIALIAVIIAAFVAFVFTTPNGGAGEAGSQSGFFDSLFPFDFSGDDGSLFEGGGETPTESTEAAPVLRQISKDPVSGGFAFERGGQTFIRFVDRGTGHVHETVATSTTARRITNTTVPGIQETLWFDENNFIVRYLNSSDSIETFLARLSPEIEGEQRLNGLFLDSYIRAATDPQKETLLSLFTDSRGSSLVLSQPDGTNAREVFNSPITSWVPLQSADSLFVYSAPLSGFNGFLYQIKGGELTKIAGNVPGLIAKISPSGQYALLSSGSGSGVELSLLDIETGTVYESPVATLSSKCVFSLDDERVVYCGIPNVFPEASYPNDWLLGRVGFSDSIWKIAFVSESASLLNNPESTASQLIDVWRPTLTASGSHLLFINKNNLSFWSLTIDPEEEN